MTPPESKKRSNLAVKVDGTALPPDEARALWERFSDWMEDHRGDLAGFATAEGFASVHPAMDNGAPVLLLSRRDVQRPYGLPEVGQSSGRGGSLNQPAQRSGDRSRGGKTKK